MIRDILEQIQESVSLGQPYTALFAALAFPDIAGAVDSEDGRSSGEKYACWFDTYTAPRFNAFNVPYLTGEDCYQYRCVMLHQGRAHHVNSRYKRTLFVETKQENAHFNGALTVESGTVLCVDIRVFCYHIAESGYDWLDKVENTDLFQKHSAEFVSLFCLSYEP